MNIDIDPVIGHLGPLEFRWYGVIMALAVNFGVWVLSRELKRRGLSPEHALGIAVIGVPCGIIGARLVHILDHFGYYWDNPGQIIGTKLVGLAIYGVVLGGLVGLIIYCRWRKLPLLRVIDSTALAFPAAQVIGKIANIINGDTWGHATGSSWGFVYTNPNSFIPDDLLGVATHPTPVYEQLWLLVVVGILIYAIPRLMKIDGLAILLYFWLYSVGRFFISFYRVNEPVVWGLVEAQVIALVAIVVAPPLAYLLVRRARRRPAQGLVFEKGLAQKAVGAKAGVKKATAKKVAANKGASRKPAPGKAAIQKTGSAKAKRR